MNTLTDAQRDRVLALLRQGKTLRQIERETGHRRETIAAYARRARSGEVLAFREPLSLCEPHHDDIVGALEDGRSLRSLHAELVERGFGGSYSTLKRYARTRIAPASTMMIAA